MMMFSVIMASYNRKDVLRIVLDEFNKQTCLDFEIIVVDNASQDGTDQMIALEFPSVRLIRSEKNIGYKAYNEGLKIAQGQYIVLMDNDAFLKEDALEGIKHRFETERRLDVIALNIVDYRTLRSETPHWHFDTPCVHGAAFAARKEVLEKVGGYREDYFICHTDLELATRILNYGHILYYDKDIIAYHLRTKIARLKGPALFYSTRNALYYYWQYYPIFYAIVLSQREFVYGLTRAIREREILNFLKGLFFGIIGIPSMQCKRTPLKKEILPRMKLYLNTFFREPLFKKIFHRLGNG